MFAILSDFYQCVFLEDKNMLFNRTEGPPKKNGVDFIIGFLPLSIQNSYKYFILFKLHQ